MMSKLSLDEHTCSCNRCYVVFVIHLDGFGLFQPFGRHPFNAVLFLFFEAAATRPRIAPSGRGDGGRGV